MSEKEITTEYKKAEVIYLGIDTHIEKHVVARKIDGLPSQPAQCFRSQSKLIEWAVKQERSAHQVVCCYEAGPTGYGLARELIEKGITCYVISPQKFSENTDGVKTDKRDAKLLCERLFSYENGSKTAFKVVRIPTVEAEQARAFSRLRESLKKDEKRLAQRGRMLGLSQGLRMKGKWWGRKRWAELETAHPFLFELLAPIRASLLTIENEIKELTRKLEEESVSKDQLPKGLGALTWRIIKGEFHDFHRFKNRREVGSYTGLCPREWSSGGRKRQGSVNKHGNPLLRHHLVEAVWRLIKWQPKWHIWLKKKDEFLSASAARKKQLVTAMARLLAIDIWRLYTNQTSLTKLGLIPA